jgi:hypothetical protein
VAGEAGNNLSPTVTLLLNGQNGSFSIQPSPNIGSGENHLYGITSVSDAVAWAVGEYLDSASGHLFTLVLTGGASAWTQVPSPNPGSANGNSELSGVTVVDGVTWAVGTFDGATAQQTLILRCQ